MCRNQLFLSICVAMAAAWCSATAYCQSQEGDTRTPTTQRLSEQGSNSPPLLYPIIHNGEWGYIDQSGSIVIKPQFDAARGFSQGLAAVKAGWFSKKWGYIDTTGKYVIKRTFDEVRDFVEELACVQVDGKWGYIDKSGKVAIEHRFGNAHDFSEGLAAVDIGGQWGYIVSFR